MKYEKRPTSIYDEKNHSGSDDGEEEKHTLNVIEQSTQSRSKVTLCQRKRVHFADKLHRDMMKKREKKIFVRKNPSLNNEYNTRYLDYRE